jgi:hypothetical protein
MSWDNDVPAHRSGHLECTLDATSPRPTIVRDVKIVSSRALGLNELLLSLSWQVPETANGVLSEYTACVIPDHALQDDVDAAQCVPVGVCGCMY